MLLPFTEVSPVRLSTLTLVLATLVQAFLARK